MAQILKEQKAELMRQGKWLEFVDYRSQEILDGMNAADANVKAVRKFLGGKAAKIAVAGGEDKDCEVLDRKKIVDTPEERLRQRAAANMIGSVPLAPLPVPLSAFDNKPEVGEQENVRWVADNMRVVLLDPSTCPSLRAWNILIECRENPVFRINFWKDFYSKIIPPKGQLGDDRKLGGDDGQPTIELLDRIQAMSDSAKAGVA